MCRSGDDGLFMFVAGDLCDSLLQRTPLLGPLADCLTPTDSTVLRSPLGGVSLSSRELKSVRVEANSFGLIFGGFGVCIDTLHGLFRKAVSVQGESIYIYTDQLVLSGRQGTVNG